MFTRMNTKLRNAQEVRTLVDMTQIRQFNMYSSKVGSSTFLRCWRASANDTIVKESLNYEHPTVKFCDIKQELFDEPKSGTKPAAQRTLRTTTLLVDPDDEAEAITDNDSHQWMDDKLTDVQEEENFSVAEEDSNLDAPELDDILADAPRVDKGKAKAVAEMDCAESDDEDESAPFNWGV